MHDASTRSFKSFCIYLATIEVSLGSVLHAARIPFTGYWLSLHQAFCLSRASTNLSGRFTPLNLSTTVALIRGLSPVGRRIMPMVALTLQGLLFNIGPLILGRNICGHVMGAALLSLWGFVQPLLFSYLIFGNEMIKGINVLENLLTTYTPGLSFTVFLILVVCLKIALSAVAVVMAHSSYRLDLWLSQKIQERPVIKTNKNMPLAHAVAKDLFSVWFLLPLGLVMLLFWWQEQSLSYSLLLLSGYIAQAIVICILLRMINPTKVIQMLRTKGFIQLSSGLRAFLFNTHPQENPHG